MPSKTYKGKLFEQDIKNSAEKQGLYFLRLKDSSQSFEQMNQIKGGYSWNNPYDCLIYGENKLFAIEMKSTKESNISFKMIRDNQINGLLKAKSYNICAGFLFNFRDDENKNSNDNVTYWMPINNFMNFKNNTNKKSINKNDICDFGGVVLTQKLKRVRYEYDIRELIKYGDF